MKEACLAVFHHSVSTDDSPRHQYCPDSWCKYQRALATRQDVPPHSPRIPADLETFVQPVFDRLCDEELLKKCLKGATQNRNESFNNLIWARAPKMEFCSLATVQIPVSNATIVFNSGAKALQHVMRGLGITAAHSAFPP